jgi:hypothetical protein
VLGGGLQHGENEQRHGVQGEVGPTRETMIKRFTASFALLFLAICGIPLARATCVNCGVGGCVPTLDPDKTDIANAEAAVAANCPCLPCSCPTGTLPRQCKFVCGPKVYLSCALAQRGGRFAGTNRHAAGSGVGGELMVQMRDPPGGRDDRDQRPDEEDRPDDLGAQNPTHRPRRTAPAIAPSP